MSKGYTVDDCVRLISFLKEEFERRTYKIDEMKEECKMEIDYNNGIAFKVHEKIDLSQAISELAKYVKDHRDVKAEEFLEAYNSLFNNQEEDSKGLLERVNKLEAKVAELEYNMKFKKTYTSPEYIKHPQQPQPYTPTFIKDGITCSYGNGVDGVWK